MQYLVSISLIDGQVRLVFDMTIPIRCRTRRSPITHSSISGLLTYLRLLRHFLSTKLGIIKQFKFLEIHVSFSRDKSTNSWFYPISSDQDSQLHNLDMQNWHRIKYWAPLSLCLVHGWEKQKKVELNKIQRLGSFSSSSDTAYRCSKLQNLNQATIICWETK